MITYRDDASYVLSLLCAEMTKRSPACRSTKPLFIYLT